MSDFDHASLLPLIREITPGHHHGRQGIHGITHWARVLANGLRLALVPAFAAH